MKYKLICYNGYVIPVPEKYNWMAWDRNGESFVYVKKPTREESAFFPSGNTLMLLGNLPHPEPGPWYEQIYWIGG